MRPDDITGAAGRSVVKVVHRCTDATENQHLDLSDCSLMMFPDAVFFLMRHSVVLACDLSFNVLKKLPPKFPQKFSEITELNLSHNRLSSLPDELADLPHLKKLNISHNDYMSLPWVVFKLKHIVALDATHNYIADVEASRFKVCCPSLKEVHLEENPLTQSSYKEVEKHNDNLNEDDVPGPLIHVTPPSSDMSSDSEN